MRKSAVFAIAGRDFPNVLNAMFRENRLLGHAPRSGAAFRSWGRTLGAESEPHALRGKPRPVRFPTRTPQWRRSSRLGWIHFGRQQVKPHSSASAGHLSYRHRLSTCCIRMSFAPASSGECSIHSLEGTGFYGVGLGSCVRRHAVCVVEVNRCDRRKRRKNGKSDTLDAETAARSVLAGIAMAVPKTADGASETVRQIKIARDTTSESQECGDHHAEDADRQRAWGAARNTRAAHRSQADRPLRPPVRRPHRPHGLDQAFTPGARDGLACPHDRGQRTRHGARHHHHDGGTDVAEGVRNWPRLSGRDDDRRLRQSLGSRRKPHSRNSAAPDRSLPRPGSPTGIDSSEAITAKQTRRSTEARYHVQVAAA